MTNYKKKDHIEIEDAPTAREEIFKLLQKYGHKTGQDPINYVLNLFEPIKPGEKRFTDKFTGITHDRYAERIAYLFGKYLKMPKEMQDLIKGARAEEIFWRGDEQKFFINLVKETQKMREMGVSEYRKQALSALGCLKL